MIGCFPQYPGGKVNVSKLAHPFPLMLLTGVGIRRSAMLHLDSNMLSFYLSVDFHIRHRTPCLQTNNNVYL